jgi:hypothetical protein
MATRVERGAQENDRAIQHRPRALGTGGDRRRESGREAEIADQRACAFPGAFGRREKRMLDRCEMSLCRLRASGQPLRCGGGAGTQSSHVLQRAAKPSGAPTRRDLEAAARHAKMACRKEASHPPGELAQCRRTRSCRRRIGAQRP